MKVVSKFLPAVFIVFAILTVSCNRKTTIRQLEFPSTPIVSGTERFALVIDPYISMRDEPGEKGITIAHARRSEMYSVDGKRIIRSGNKQTVWIDLGKGWVPETSVQLYSSAEKAKTASELLK